ncbi:MAG: ATP synthase F1 subunit delta [Bacteroidales bacterium]|nr:ATP synthase F1 subunit delta [Bacteroidales bacterium]
MVTQQLLIRYAKSFFSLVEEKNQLIHVEKDLEHIYRWVNQHPEFCRIMKNPIIKPHVKIQLVRQLFLDAHPLILSFFNIIIQKQRANILPDILKTCYTLLLEKNKKIEVLLLTAQSLDHKTKDLLAKKIHEHTGYQPIIQEIMKPDLIGGFIIRMKDYSYDASIRRKLNLIARNFSINLYERKL